MEILSIRLKTTKSTWLELYNVYLPNNFTQHNLFDPSLIKPAPSSLVPGDLNTSMATLKCGIHYNLKTNVVTKFLTRSSTTTYIYLMTALLLELVELPEMIVPPTSPSVGVTGQRNHPGD